MRLLLFITLFLKATVSIPPLQINGIDCTCDGDICMQPFCSLTNKRANLNWANWGFFVAQPINSAFVRTQFYNQYGSDFVEVGPPFYENICNMSAARSRSLAFVIMLTDMRLYATNFKCPFENNITMTNFPPDIMLFPKFVTTKQYKVNFSIGSTLTNMTCFSVSLYLYTTLV